MRCKATSKRTGVQCRKHAMIGKRVCLAHGGASTGPKTEAGRKRCAEAKTVHGRETRGIRKQRSLKMAELAKLEELIKIFGKRQKELTDFLF